MFENVVLEYVEGALEPYILKPDISEQNIVLIHGISNLMDFVNCDGDSDCLAIHIYLYIGI